MTILRQQTLHDCASEENSWPYITKQSMQTTCAPHGNAMIDIIDIARLLGFLFVFAFAFEQLSYEFY